MKEKILIVDDEIIIRSCVTSIFGMKGYAVETASDGRAAMDIIVEKETQPEMISLVITDLNMPVMNGLQLLEEVRKLKRKIPVLVMSGDFSPDVIKKILQMGVDDILQKPFMPEELLYKAKTVLTQNIVIEN